MRKLTVKFLAIVTVISMVIVFTGAANDMQIENQENIDILQIGISDWFDLDDVRNDLSGSYVLMNDLDEDTPGYDELAGPGANAGAGWDPLGSHTPRNPFTGTFDGQGYSIKGLYINRPDQQVVGLFGKTDDGAVIRNLGLKDVDITGADGAGALVGVTRDDSWIEGCYVEGGSVEGVSNTDFSVGGMVAQNAGVIRNSYTSVTVVGENLLHIGGIVGLHLGFLRNSYATGEVIGGGNVGGLVGTNAAITDYPSRGHVTNSYSDSDTTGVSVPIGNNGGISENVEAHPTSTMQTFGTYAPLWDIAPMDDWDMETWFIDDGVDYPRLYYQIPSLQLTIDVEGTGTTDPTPGTHSYTWGEEVTITASPGSGYIFNNWLGDYTNHEDKYDHEITIAMDGHKELTSQFIEEGRRSRVVESQLGWEHETESHNRTSIIDGALHLGEIKTDSRIERETYPGAGTTWQTYWETTVDVGGADTLSFHCDYNLQVFAGSTPRYAEVRLTIDEDEVWIDSLTPQNSYSEAIHEGVVDVTGQTVITLRFQARSTRHTWVTDPVATIYRAGYSVYVPEDEGTWLSKSWYPDFMDDSEIDYFETKTEIGSGQDISARIGVDSTDDGTVDSWSDWNALVNGVNVLHNDELDLPPGYGYQVEYQLQGGPKVLGYRMEVMEDFVGVNSFDVTVDDITVGDQPLVQISNGIDDLGDPLVGNYRATITIDDETDTVDLSFSAGSASHEWHLAMMEIGTYTATVTISRVTNSDTFQVTEGDVDRVDISPDTPQSITAGGTVEFSAYAYDSLGNLITDVATDFTWTNAGTDGTFDQTSVGVYEVTASYGGVTSPVVEVTVNHGNTHTVAIDPSGTVTVMANEDLQFSAEALDAYGNIITDTVADFTWSGASESGLFNQETPGEYEVSADYEGVTSPVTIVTVEELPEGAYFRVEITGYDSQVMVGNVVTVEYTIRNVGDLTGTQDIIFTVDEVEYDANQDLTLDPEELHVGLFSWTSETPGTFTLGVSSDNSTRSVTVTVSEPEVDHIRISPSEATISMGDSQTYTATAYDEHGDVLGTVTGMTTWSIEQGAGGIWDENVYTSEFEGTWTVTGTYEGFVDTAMLTVVDDTVPVDHIVLSPSESTISAGEVQEYTVTAYDEVGNLIGDVSISSEFDISLNAGGSWEDNKYTGGFAGTWTVTATYGGATDSANLTVVPGSVAVVELSPSRPIEVIRGTDRVFSASAYDGYGNLITNDVNDFSWINAIRGVFNKDTLGEYRVTATYGVITSPATMVTVITAGPAQFEFFNLRSTPRVAYRGHMQEFVFELDVENVGYEPGEHTIRFYIDGTPMGSITVYVDSGETVTASISHYEDGIGIYNVTVEGMVLQVEVVESRSESIRIVRVMGFIILLIIAAAALYYLKFIKNRGPAYTGPEIMDDEFFEEEEPGVTFECPVCRASVKEEDTRCPSCDTAFEEEEVETVIEEDISEYADESEEWPEEEVTTEETVEDEIFDDEGLDEELGL